MSEPLVDVTGARRRRARARLRRRLRVAGIVLGVLAVLGAGAWAVLGSPLLAASEVRVTGTRLLTPDQVAQAAAIPLGGPLAQVDTAGAEQRVREGLPAVASARVQRAWPNAVTVEVTEATPSMVIAVPGSWVWVAGDGRSFHSTPERPEGVLEAQGALSDEEVLLTLARVADELPVEVAEQGSVIRATSVDSVVVELADKRRVVWGSAEDGALKADVLVPLLKVKAVEYDVSAPTHPTTR